MLKRKKIIKIAIDSPAAAGAGTIAKAISKEYNLFYLDTGKIYRLIAYLKLKYPKKFNLVYIKKKIKSLKIKNYKKSFLFEYFINNWPQIYGTSSILIKSNLLSSFFKKAKPFKWPLLAIDIQLLIFCNIFYDVTNYGNSLTLKRIHGRNLGDKYLKLFSRKFWIRRNMQFKYNSFLRKKNIINIDCLFTNLICKIIK